MKSQIMDIQQTRRSFSWDFHRILRMAAVPLALFGMYLVFIAAYRLLVGPSPDALVGYARQGYSDHGYWVVFGGALIEGVLVVNWYLPGSLVVALGMIFSRQGTMDPFVVIVLAVIGFFISTILNYILGKCGWYGIFLRLGLRTPLEKARLKLLDHGLPLIFTTYFHPHFGAVVATGCGVLRLPLGKFLSYSLLALLAWNSLWGGLIYWVGPSVLNLLNMWIAIPFLIAWILFFIVRYYRQKKPD